MVNPSLENAIVTISKDKLATLPAAEYSAGIVVIDTLEKIPEAISSLRKFSILGFDTETRPSFKKGVIYNVSLIQIASPEGCFLFRTNKIGFPAELMEILADPSILKVGVSIHDDFHNLRKIAEIDPASFIDLQHYVKQFKIADNSLSRIYAILFGQRISKGQRLTNWEAPELSESQQKYAALDAGACLSIYSYLSNGKFDPSKSAYLTFPAPDEDQTSPDK